MIINNEFNFCPNCGTNKIKYLQNKKWFCSECGFDLYNNVASAVGVIFHDKDCNVLFYHKKITSKLYHKIFDILHNSCLL